MTRREFNAALLAAAATALSACSIFRRSTVRPRMTVDVRTPDGLRSGTCIVESTFKDGPATGQAAGLTHEVQGEAVAIDLPGGTLFALMQNDKSGFGYVTDLLHFALMRGVVTPAMPRSWVIVTDDPIVPTMVDCLGFRNIGIEPFAATDTLPGNISRQDYRPALFRRKPVIDLQTSSNRPSRP